MIRPRALSALLFLAFAMPGQESEDKPWFGLQTSGSVAPGEEAKINLQSTNIRTLEFRLYKVNDVEKFLLGLPDPHRFGGGSWRPSPSAKTPLEQFARWKHRWWARLRDLARAQYTPDQRAAIRLRQEAKKPPAQREQYVPGTPLNTQQLVRSWDVPIQQSKRWSSSTVPLRIEKKGLYVLEATDGKLTATSILSVTDLALLVKGAPGRLLAWAVNRHSGQPAAGAALRIFDTDSRTLLADLKTSAGGEASAAISSVTDQGVIVLARQGDDIALSTGSGYSIKTDSPDRLQGVVYTDRPVYRPGHTLHFRAIVRESAPEGYRLPSTRVRAEITSPEGNVITRRDGKLSSFGTFSGEWTVPPGAPLGDYSLRVNAEDSGPQWSGIYGSFNVEEYRKPDFEVRVTPAERRLNQGATATFTIDARYFYGEPVPGASVTYTVKSRRAWLPWMIEDDEEIGANEDETWSGEAEAERSGTLDKEGRLTVQTPLRRAKFDLRYTIEAKVRDSSGRTFEGRGSLLATVGPFFLTVEPDSYVAAPGQESTAVVTARDYDGKPLPNIDLSLKLAEYRWREGEQEMPAVWNGRHKTGPDGTVRVRVPIPGPGSWRLTAQSAAASATIQADTYLWAEGAVSQSSQDIIRIVPDKRKYAPGDTARVLIIPSVKVPSVWASIEGRTLYASRFLDSSKGSAVLEFKIEDQHTPNVFIECIFIHANTVHQGSKRLKVPPVHKTLNVALQPSKPQFKPGEPASYTLSATDHQGRPARAAFSIGVVDEAIYALYRDQLPDLIQPFYGAQWNRIQTEHSLEYYFYGEAGKRRVQLASSFQPRAARGQLKPERLVEPKIRKEFPDTAFWVADVETSPAGKAIVNFSYPDSLTAWRATARGVTEDTRLGQATDRVLVRKDLLIAPAVPRFLTEGDTVRTPMLVRNYSADPATAEVSVTGQGLRVLDGASGRITAAPRGEARLDSTISAGPVSEAVLLAKALTSTESDAVELKIPVEPAGLSRRAVSSLSSPAGSLAPLSARHTFPATADAAWRQTVIRVTPSPAGALFEGLEYLLDYPYGCTEQTMSGLLPNLAAAQAVDQLGLTGAIDRNALAARVRSGLERLKRMQQDDGGWGWWSGGDVDPYLTAYVMWGFHIARSSGFPLGQEYFEGMGRLQKLYDTPRDTQPDTLALQLYVLSLAKAATPARIEKAFALQPRLSPFGLAFLGLALREAGDTRSASIASTLASQAAVDGPLAHWDVNSAWRWDFPTEGSTEATAMAVKLIAAETPGHPLVNQAASWLIARRSRGYYWTNTKTTAFAILGLTGALARSGELMPDGAITVLLNGAPVWKKNWTAADALRKPDNIALSLDARPGEHTVEIRKTGSAALNASVEWLWRERDAVASSAGGLAIHRMYHRLVPNTSGGRLTHTLEALAGPVRVGDTLAITLTVNSTKRHQYLILEDRLPSGAEALDSFDGYEIRPRPPWWFGWFDRRELRDARVLWYPQTLGAGVNHYTYLIRFTNAGRFQVAPARIETMYDASAQAWSDSLILEVQP